MIALLYILFFVTGAAGMVFETAFARQLQLIFGSTLSSVSVVVAVFFGGMALGAALLGRYADRYSPVRLYGILEIGAAAWALLAVLLVPQVRAVYSHVRPLIPHSGIARILSQSVLAAVVLLPLTMLIGATLPALCRGLTRSLGERFTRIAGLYGINTLGAAAGTIVCGFVLLEHLGYTASVLLAAVVSLSAGLAAFLLASRTEILNPVSEQESHDAPPKPQSCPGPETDGSPRVILVLTGLAGLAALGLEIVWFRTLSFSVVADAYAFAMMLGVYLFGIAAGGLVGAWRFRRTQGSLLELGLMEICLCLVAMGGFAALTQLAPQLARSAGGDPTAWLKDLSNTAMLALLLILPATVIMGYVFPMFASLYASHGKNLGSEVGRVTAVNTTGGIAGALAAGFVSIPLMGIQKSLLFFAGLSLLVGVGAFLFSKKRSRPLVLSFATALIAALVALLFFPVRQNFGFLQIPGHEKAELLFYRESSDQTVMVTRDTGGRKIQRLILNQQQATSTSLAGQRKNQLLGHLPLWSCPEARTALVICFGSGGTFGALGLYDLESVDCVEICLAVVEAAHLFSMWNGDVLSRSNAHLIVDDGRSHLITTRKLYDIITLEPMHPGLKGVSSLYSVEFYAEARDRLGPGGVLCQWIPLYSMTGEDARSLIATALAVFPESSFWLVGPEGILVCAADSLFISWDWLQSTFRDEGIQQALRQVRLEDPWAILSGYLAGPEELGDFVQGAPLLRDDRPFTEYSIPRHKHVSPWEDILLLVTERQSPLGIVRGLQAGEFDSLEAVWSSKRDAWIERDRGLAAFSLNDMPGARVHLEAALQGDPTDRYTTFFLQEVYWRYGLELGRQGRTEEAVNAYRAAAVVEPEDPESHFYLAVALANAGKLREAEREALTALNLEPKHQAARELLSTLGSVR
jgi:spermidine synthase